MTKADHPCAGMTKRAREIFEQIAIGNDGGHHPRVIEALCRRGLIERHGVDVASGIPGVKLTVDRYAVPLIVHMAWCAWCGENVSDADIEGGA
ncbi:MAG: hypothetical protein C0447_00260 [Methylobacterium sp.]|nr:hypothetical protein [Methylobacterium sp.]